jgi:hypothetical protein
MGNTQDKDYRKIIKKLVVNAPNLCYLSSQSDEIEEITEIWITEPLEIQAKAIRLNCPIIKTVSIYGWIVFDLGDTKSINT